ncbi:hypothetical protein, partial [Prosthecobacter sp.]|uniref:hypothetical protein n=1 Tax=Prosthecobacter sp. TaxID=1965333 RepID=UPI003904857A
MPLSSEVDTNLAFEGLAHAVQMLFIHQHIPRHAQRRREVQRGICAQVHTPKRSLHVFACPSFCLQCLPIPSLAAACARMEGKNMGRQKYPAS